MSLATIDIHEYGDKIRAAIAAMLLSKAGPVLLPKRLDVTIEAQGDHVSIDWKQKVEADLPGVNPDMIRGRAYPDHAIVDLRISNLRINY